MWSLEALGNAGGGPWGGGREALGGGREKALYWPFWGRAELWAKRCPQTSQRASNPSRGLPPPILLWLQHPWSQCPPPPSLQPTAPHLVPAPSPLGPQATCAMTPWSCLLDWLTGSWSSQQGANLSVAQRANRHGGSLPLETLRLKGTGRQGLDGPETEGKERVTTRGETASWPMGEKAGGISVGERLNPLPPGWDSPVRHARTSPVLAHGWQTGK